MGYTIVSHGVIQENDEGLHLTGGYPSTVFHGAQIQRFGKEILVEMVEDDPPDGDLGAGILLADAIPVGAFNVWVTGRVSEEIVTDPVGGPFYCTARDAVSSGSDEYSGDNGVFGRDVAVAVGTTWGPGGTFVTDHWEGGYEPNSGASPGVSSTDNGRWFWPGGGDVYFSCFAGPFVSGQVRLVIFYSLITPPTS